MIICKTPFRISFFGGGTDFPQWYEKNEGFVISSTIDKYCYVTLRTLPPYFNFKFRLRYYKTELTNTVNQIKHSSIREVLKIFNKKNKGLEITHFADLPAKSGLGASSAFSVSLINLIHFYNNIRLSKKNLAQKTIYLEQKLLKESIGSQDQTIASYGGFNSILFKKNNILVKKLLINKNKKQLLEDHSLLFFSGVSRYANKIEKDKMLILKDNKFYYKEIFNLAKEAEKIFLSNTANFIQEIGSLLHKSWSLKKRLSTKVSNNYLNNIYDIAHKNGSIGGKLLGAGGGGFFLFLAKDLDHKKRLIKKLKPIDNLTYVNFKFVEESSKIIYNIKDYYDI
jgi:D-glycero-alpha-D-manno-heptose-7-phosphate kinase